MTLKEHFEVCEGRPTLNDETRPRKVKNHILHPTNRLDYPRYVGDLPLNAADLPSITNTGDIPTDYNNIKAIKYPEKTPDLKAPPATVYVEHDSRPKVITTYDSRPRVIATTYDRPL